jgi:hypothetical protein
MLARLLSLGRDVPADPRYKEAKATLASLRTETQCLLGSILQFKARLDSLGAASAKLG